MISVLHSVLRPKLCKLGSQRLLVYTDTHRGYLKATLKGLVPEEQVTVEVPVVVVGCSAVVAFTARKLAADLLDEHSAVLTADQILTLLGGLVRESVLQLLGRHKDHILVHRVVEHRITQAHLALGVDDRLDDGLDGFLQEFLIALLTGDDLLPVPLIDKDRMDVVSIIITADRIHIGVNAFARTVAVTVERHALPLCKGLYDLCLLIADLLDGKIDLALYAIEVVVDTASLLNDQGRCHTVKGQRKAQCLLKQILDVLDSVLGLTQCQGRCIALRQIKRFRHSDHPFSKKQKKSVLGCTQYAHNPERLCSDDYILYYTRGR